METVAGSIHLFPYSVIYSEMFIFLLVYARHCSRHPGNNSEQEALFYGGYNLLKEANNKQADKYRYIITFQIVIFSMKIRKRN